MYSQLPSLSQDGLMVDYCSSQPITPSIFFVTNIKLADI